MKKHVDCLAMLVFHAPDSIHDDPSIHPRLTDIFPRWRPTQKLLHYNMEIQQKPHVTSFIGSQPTPFQRS